MPPTTRISVGVDISSSVDPLFYGYALATVLFGGTLAQACLYSMTTGDRWPLKVLVGSLVLMDFSTTVIESQILHHILVSSFGNVDAISSVAYDLPVEAIITAVITLIAQGYFAFRVLRMNKTVNKNYLLPISILAPAIAGFGLALFTDVGHIVEHQATDLSTEEAKIQSTICNGLYVISDVLATFALCRSFFKARCGVQRTDRVLQSLFIFVLTRGILVTFSQIMILVLYAIETEKQYWMPFHLAQSKLYSITMIAMLNARPGLRSKLENASITDLSLYVTTTPRKVTQDTQSQTAPSLTEIETTGSRHDLESMLTEIMTAPSLTSGEFSRCSSMRDLSTTGRERLS